MQIVIDIKKREWEYLNKLVENGDQLGHYERLLVNGTPLPKGHGKLIDADDLRLDIIGHKYSNNFCEEHNIDWSINLGMLNILLADAPTILEADKAESED